MDQRPWHKTWNSAGWRETFRDTDTDKDFLNRNVTQGRADKWNLTQLKNFITAEETVNLLSKGKAYKAGEHPCEI